MRANELRTQTSEVLGTLEVSNGFKDSGIGPMPVDWEVTR